MMIERNISKNLIAALSDRPVVLLNGARQTGKSTLAQWIGRQRSLSYLTLDDVTVLSSARKDPAGFISELQGGVILDEVQRAPELFLAIKAEVDRNRVAGRFLLTGSANIFLLPKISEYLVGRMEILTLWPLSQDELQSRRAVFIDGAFSEKFPLITDPELNRKSLIGRLAAGGYPEVQFLSPADRRKAWFSSYVTTLVQRDVRDLSNVEGLHEMPRLLSLLAAQSASLLNVSELSRNTGLPQMTLKRYLTLLQATFLVHLVPAWFGNIGKRLIKSPRVYLNDAGLLTYLNGMDTDRLLESPEKMGHILENFVVAELMKQITWSQTQPRVFYYRTAAGQEVDVVLENAAGKIVGIEVKSAATVTARDFKGLQDLSAALGERFLRGLLLYPGPNTVPFGNKLYAVPLSALWKLVAE